MLMFTPDALVVGQAQEGLHLPTRVSGQARDLCPVLLVSSTFLYHFYPPLVPCRERSPGLQQLDQDTSGDKQLLHPHWSAADGGHTPSIAVLEEDGSLSLDPGTHDLLCAETPPPPPPPPPPLPFPPPPFPPPLQVIST